MSPDTSSLTIPEAVQAAERAGVKITEQGLRLWCKRYPSLARFVVSRWVVDGATLSRLLAGERLPRGSDDGNTSLEDRPGLQG